jgi:EndoU nuclease-like protein
LLLVAMPLVVGEEPAMSLFEPVTKFLRRTVVRGGRYHHVFEGTVRFKGGGWVGTGWHHRFMGQDPAGHRVTEILRRDINGTYVARVEMKAPDGQWVAKPAGSSFFPDNWTPKRVSDTIHEAFANRRTTPDTRNRRWEGYANGLWVQGSYNQTGKTWNSAWPIVQ